MRTKGSKNKQPRGLKSLSIKGLTPAELAIVMVMAEKDKEVANKLNLIWFIVFVLFGMLSAHLVLTIIK